MRIPPLIQPDIIEVSNWEQDDEFFVFPQGARAKEAVLAPTPAQSVGIVPERRYLFKRSKASYPDQFWGEIIAYRIGCLMGLPVPPAFAATNARTNVDAALIEWFYDDPAERFVHGGEFLQRIRPGFDREKGRQHNLQDVAAFMRALASRGLLMEDWRLWWTRALLFDALIGNTDRHQDNWGFIFSTGTREASTEQPKARLAPLFDNGTSLGHERFVDRVSHWTDNDVDRYINRGVHHIKWNLTDAPPIRQHHELLRHAVGAWKTVSPEVLLESLDFEGDDLAAATCDLMQLPMRVPLTPERMAFVLRLLTRRLTLLKNLLHDLAESPR